jgi:hypothetical protein
MLPDRKNRVFKAAVKARIRREEEFIDPAVLQALWETERITCLHVFLSHAAIVRPQSVRADLFARTLVARSRGLSQTGQTGLRSFGLQIMSEASYRATRAELIQQHIEGLRSVWPRRPKSPLD